MNTNIRDAGNFFLSWPVCEARQTVVQSIPTGVLTGLLFNVNDIDTDGGHSTVTNTSRYTGKTAGRYQLAGATSWVSSTPGTRAALWAANGAGAMAASQLAGTGQVAARTRTFFLNGTSDYVELFVFQDSGGAVNTDLGVVHVQPNMSIRMVGTT